MNRAEYRHINASFFNFIAEHAISSSQLFLTDMVLCRDVGGCLIEQDGKPFYFDDNHLTLTGSQYLVPLFDALADTILQG